MTTLTTAQAAKRAGITPVAFRSLAHRARVRDGVDLRAPRDAWPDARTPLYDAGRLDTYLAARPGRGRSTK